MKVENITSSKNHAHTNINFNATLRVKNCALAASKAIPEKFQYVVALLRKKLSADPLNASDVVELRALKGIGEQIPIGGSYQKGRWKDTGGYGGRVFEPELRQVSSSYAGVTYEPVYVPNTATENLELGINRSKCGFYFNNERTAEEISEDLYNAYKHVRYLEHYKP